jgi:hypothetical protein
MPELTVYRVYAGDSFPVNRGKYMYVHYGDFQNSYTILYREDSVKAVLYAASFDSRWIAVQSADTGIAEDFPSFPIVEVSHGDLHAIAGDIIRWQSFRLAGQTVNDQKPNKAFSLICNRYAEMEIAHLNSIIDLARS